ncbi:MAG: hypothetical protein M0P12_11795 [Paludibacteraceae bacterium]|nr:hypothetical protein [Paludibacteraceae bacterium]
MKKLLIVLLMAISVNALAQGKQNDTKSNGKAKTEVKVKSKQESVQSVYKFLKEAGVYYIATIDGDRPQLRPFGSLNIYDGELEIQTGHVKNVDHQIQKNPNVCIVALKGHDWIRIDATLKEDTRIKAKEAMLETMPQLKSMYKADDANTAVYMLTKVQAKNMTTGEVYEW